MSQNMRGLIRIVCWLLILAPVGIVGWLATSISRGNVDAFLTWDMLYNYITLGGLGLSCLLLAVIAAAPPRRTKQAVALLGISLLAIGIVGYYGFKSLSLSTLAPIPPMKQLKPNAAKTVLGFHYLCPTAGGSVAFGDGSVRYVEQAEFAQLRHADTPDQTPEFISPIKEPSVDEVKDDIDEQKQGNPVSRAQNRITHSNNLKQMAIGHFRFRPRDGIRIPLKPEHFMTHSAMSDELKNSISDGTYVWYFGWAPTVSYAAEKTRAIWYELASLASIFIGGWGVGTILGALVLAMKRSALAPVGSSNPA